MKKNSSKVNNSINNESDKKENPKLKLFTALNNINDEINIKIDSKDNLFNNKLNLDCFINKKPTTSGTKSPEKFVNKAINNNFISPPTNKDESFHPFIKTETNNEQKNLRKINKIKEKNIKTDPRQLMKYINSDNNNSRNSKSKYSENNNKSIKENSETNYLKKLEYIKDNDNIEESNNNFIEMNKKITVYNLENDDKLLLKDLENKNALSITDISSLNKKNIVNYNISLSNFDPKKLINYYLYLEDEYRKEEMEINKLKIDAEKLKKEYLNLKRNEMNQNKEKNDEDNNKLSNIRSKNNYSTLSLGKLGPASRYQNDLNFFEDLIIKMNDELKNI